ncbi:MAG: phage tail protein [Schwartzia sp.]|nr:phage tail protein [Schwartzia sp. (in: firmicutes)]
MSFLTSVADTYKKQAQTAAQNVAQSLLSAARGQLSALGLSAPLGSFGDIVFEVSSRKMLTFRDYKRDAKARYASHEIIAQKPILEYLGPDGGEISFAMQFRADRGVNPAAEADRVRKICEAGEAAYFVLGNTVIGENPWIIASVGENDAIIDNMGRIIQNKIDVTLREYVPQIS